MPTLDPKRNFDEDQRRAIYKRDNGCCQIAKKCSGGKVAWSNAHIDHKTPHSKGGRTIISNGQVSCRACNLDKSDNRR